MKCECLECGQEFENEVACEKCPDCVEWEAENLCPMCGMDELHSYEDGRFCRECGWHN